MVAAPDTVRALAFVLLLSASAAWAAPEAVRLADPPSIMEPEVDFLSTSPAIDGVLDDGLERLPERSFSLVWKSEAANDQAPARFRLGYGTGFFYVYVESEGDSLVFRDRAFQNGDGFVILLGARRPGGSPTDEFYVLACSAVDQARMEWTRHVFWYVNVEHLFVPTSDDTRVEFRAHDGRISFELLLPWSDIRPYHPWTFGEMAFAMTFTKGIGEKDRNIHLLLDDEIGAEMSPRRYARLRFAEPHVTGPSQTFASVERGNLPAGDSVRVSAVTAAGEFVRQVLEVSLLSGEGERLRRSRLDLTCLPGLTRATVSLATTGLTPGGYSVAWRASGTAESHGKAGLTLLPAFDPIASARVLDSCADRIRPGSATTLRFLLQELTRDVAALRPYETCAGLRIWLDAVAELLAAAERGDDRIASRTGVVRRAFRSGRDETLQPYCVRVPEAPPPSPERGYPLLVFLHGSGSDETAIGGFPYLSPGGFLEVAPFGRGPSNAFATPEAQADICEAMDDAAANYAVDTSRVVLAGFSMGGYGVYRTFFEHPGRFDALAIFSGHPDLGNRYVKEGGQPSFLDEENLTGFRDIPVFLFHGEQDRNLPCAETRSLAEKLQRAGARVELQIEPETGHSAPGPETVATYHRWLKDVLAAKR